MTTFSSGGNPHSEQFKVGCTGQVPELGIYTPLSLKYICFLAFCLYSMETAKDSVNGPVNGPVGRDLNQESLL